MKIYNLRELPIEAYGEAGGKARGLAQLIRIGLNVPSGFVVIGAEPSNVDDVIAFYKSSKLTSVAVRSSATNEDGADFSNAGQYQTHLNVEGADALKKAFIDCLDSLNGKNVKSYSSFFSQGEGAMSVVVQQMVDADCAGVAFSKDPAMQGGAIIEAVEGLGEALVSGAATAERYIHGEENACKLLSKPQEEELFSKLFYIERELGYPVDIEWAIKDGTLYLLQARPITTLNQPTLGEFDPKTTEGAIYSNCNIGEMLPGAVTPLSLSTTVRAIDFGLRKMLVTAGVYKSMDDLAVNSCVLSFSGHLFFNLKPLFKMESVVLGAAKKMIVAGMCGRELDIPDDNEKKRNIFLRMHNGGKYFRFISSGNKARKEIEQLAAGFKIAVTGDIAADYRAIDSSIPVLNHSLTLHYRTSSQSGAMSTAVLEVLKKSLSSPEEINARAASLLEDIDGIESADILRALRDIAAKALKENPSAKDMTAAELQAMLEGSSGELRAAFDYFLSRHGHRAVREAELRSKSWKDDITALCDHLLTVMSADIKPERTSSADKNIEEFIKTQKVLSRPIIRYLIKEARSGVRNREFSKSRFIKIIDEFKDAYNALSKNLVAAGALPDNDLIYFLTHEELGQLIESRNAALIKRALLRRTLLSEQQELKYNILYLTAPTPIIENTQPAESGAVLSGVSISRGVVTGRARVVKSPEDAKKLVKGEIMVAACTDIGWSPYYSVVGGLITEAGSVLSHGAVVAREYALPLIVNVPSATSRIKTGCLLTLNATLGTLTILEE